MNTTETVLYHFARREQNVEITVTEFTTGGPVEIKAFMHLGTSPWRVPFTLEDAFERELRDRLRRLPGSELHASGTQFVFVELEDARGWQTIVESITYWFGVALRYVGKQPIERPPAKPRARQRRLAENLLRVSAQISAKNDYILTSRQRRQVDFELFAAGIPPIGSIESDRARFLQEPLQPVTTGTGLLAARTILLEPGDRVPLQPAEAALLLPQAGINPAEFRDAAGRSLADALKVDTNRRYALVQERDGSLSVHAVLERLA